MSKDDQIPIKEYRRDDGSVWRREWYKDGRFHRDGYLPAIEEYDKDGQISKKEWYKAGKLIKEEKF